MAVVVLSGEVKERFTRAVNMTLLLLVDKQNPPGPKVQGLGFRVLLFDLQAVICAKRCSWRKDAHQLLARFKSHIRLEHIPP